ncbi:M16 family metallopeptidase [Acidobacteriota bacterium]
MKASKRLQLNKGTSKNHLWLASTLGMILIFIFLCRAPAIAQKGPKDQFVFPPLSPVEMPEVKKLALSNGLRLFLVEDHEYPTIDIRILFRTGSAFDPSDKIGLAAISGDVLRTGGTTSKTGDEIDKELEALAAMIEISSRRSSGTMFISFLKQDIDKVLAILADILINPAFREEKIDLAKIKQKTIISRRNDEIGQITSREFRKLIFGKNSPYARHPEYLTLDAIKRDDVIRFYEKYFSPENAIVAVWGDFEAEKMAEKMEDYLGRWKPAESEISPLPEVEYEYKYTINFIDKPDVNQSNIMLGHIGGKMDNPDYPALTIMNSILSYERMFKKIRTDEGLAYSVWGTFGAGYQEAGVFSCGAQTKSESTVHAIELMFEEIKRITREKVSEKELAKAKAEYLNGYVFNFDSRAKIVSRMMIHGFYGYPLDFMERVRKEIEGVTKEDVLRVAKKYLHPDKIQVLVVGNKERFDKPLSVLGNVSAIDITISAPKADKKPGERVS